MTEKTVNNKLQTETVQFSVLPDFCDGRNLFILILLTELLALLIALVSSNNQSQFWDTLSLASIVMLWISLLNAGLLCFLRPRTQHLKPGVCLIISYSLMMLVSLVVILTISSIGDLFFTVYADQLTDNLLVLRVMTISAVAYFLIVRYFYIQYQWRLNLAAQSRAEVQALRARIRPHFLFNSMNTIASLISISPEKAENAVEDLSDLFRASLGEQNMNPLHSEIELTRSYLGIESLRLGDRLQIAWHIDDKCLNYMVPALCLQPLVENAIYHGIEPMEKGGKIEVSALQIDNSLQISVSNPLSPENKLATRKKGNQMAQDNIRQRLNLVYGNRSKFSINDTKEKYTVSLLIPLDVKHERINR